MPQYELDQVGPDQRSGLVRGRTPEEAVREGTGLPEDAAIALSDEEDVHGWTVVYLDDEPSGRLRLHQRMKFRRD